MNLQFLFGHHSQHCLSQALRLCHAGPQCSTRQNSELITQMSCTGARFASARLKFCHKTATRHVHCEGPQGERSTFQNVKIMAHAQFHLSLDLRFSLLIACHRRHRFATVRSSLSDVGHRLHEIVRPGIRVRVSLSQIPNFITMYLWRFASFRTGTPTAECPGIN